MAATMAAIMEITENIMRRMREPSTKLHNALYFMSGMMVVILALVIVAGVKTKAENAGFHIAEDTENAAVVFDIILERMGIFLCHPST